MTLEFSPHRFYKMVDAIESVDDQTCTALVTFLQESSKAAKLVKEQQDILSKAHADLHQETRSSMMNKNPFESVEKQQDNFLNFVKDVSDKNFITVAFQAIASLDALYDALLSIARDLKPRPLILRKERFSGIVNDFNELQHMKMEFEMNRPVLLKFFNALKDLDKLNDKLVEVAVQIINNIDTYHQKLVHRHTVDGVKIHRDAVITDLAILMFKNIDKHGEIAKGASADEVSAYTVRKAQILADALRNNSVHTFIENPGRLTDFLTMNLKAMKGSVDNLQSIFSEQLEEYKQLEDESALFDKHLFGSQKQTQSLENCLTVLGDIDPRNVSYRPSDKILTPEEKFNQKFQDETLEKLTALLADKEFKAEDLVKYVLERKSELKKFFQNENSFYVCKIGSGNPFLGVSPGALEVVPGEKPNASLDKILGSGFDEVKKFIGNIKDSAKWHNLFLATSPSKSADKSNVLLVGPMGSGKSEVFRAVASDPKSISVAAQGSDFNTCWKGEMEKNPKRMFQEGRRLQRESGRHVHFLIDEIDSILNNDREYGTTNLSLEFQILMDGVVRYPNLSVWGATNNPRRIPMPMIRRFSKVIICGELSQEERVKLLKHYVGDYLPTDMLSDDPWKKGASKLEGATGDIIRKVADHIWREKMSWFVHNNAEAAESLTKVLLNEEGKFDIGSFSDKDRFNFKTKLGKHIKVTQEDLLKSIDVHLNNIAIRTEIETAKSTYDDARKFLEEMNASKI